MKRLAVTLFLAVAVVVVASSTCEAGRLFRRGRAAQPTKMVKYQPPAGEEFLPPASVEEVAPPAARQPNQFGYYGSSFRYPSWPYSHGPSYGGPYWGTFTDQPYFRFGPELERAR